MLWVFFILSYRNEESNLAQLSIGPCAINTNNLRNVSSVPIKNFQNLTKYYIIFIKNRRSFFESDLSREFKNIFKPYNCISKFYYRSYLNYTDMLKLQKSQYLAIFEVSKQIKFNKVNINSKTPKKDKKSNNHLIKQYLVHASNNFPEYFQNYGKIHKIFDELYSLTLNQGNFSLPEFNKQIETVQDDLINSNEVFKFEVSPKVTQFNRFSIGYIQTGTYELTNSNNLIHSYNPLHELSITGTNEVVTISDSGVSPNVDWFMDPNLKTYPYNKYEPSQRKIVYYSTYNIRGTTDQTDYSGHGTHVAGSVLGNSMNSNKLYSLYNGAAPDAKAIIVDLEDGTGNMYIDIELSQTLNKMKSYNSFINTNSWGAESDSTTINLLYNTAAVANPEILFIFAAGNYGRYQSIYSPGSSKNVLTVGALGMLHSSYLNSSQAASNKNIQFEVIIDDEKQKLFTASSLNRIDSGNQDFSDFGFKSILSTMTSDTDINTIYDVPIIIYDQSLSDFSNNAVIVSNCNEATDSLNKNARVIIVKSSNDLQPKSCNNQNLQNKAFGIELSLTNSQLQLLSGKKLTITPQIITNEYPTIAYYSSKGPSYTGAIKPEIVAPGTNITSASRISSSKPQLAVMSGTSMSTPLVAGALATLRQYLIEKRGLNSKAIYSHLMKAIAIASADKPNPKIPDIEYGFGRLNLANVIPELSSINANPKLQLEFLTDLKFKSESVYLFSFEVTSKDKHDVRVAFSYLDDSTQYSDQLIIKANMNVQTPDKNLLFPLGDEIEDSFSSYERIYIPKEELNIGIYTIVISTSESSFDNLINASIVVSGEVRNLRQITDAEATTSIQSIFDWSQYCKVDNTVSTSNAASIASSNFNECQCNQYSSGLICQHKSKPIPFGVEDVVRLGPYETCYYYSTLNDEIYNGISFNWEQHNSQQNYIMLRLNIGSSNKRLGQYQYFFSSNKTKANVGGPANIEGGSIMYEKGTLFFFTYTNLGSRQVALTISSTIDTKSRNKGNGMGVSLSISLYLVIVVIILIVLVVIFITCKKRKRRNAQIDGATSSSISSSAGAENPTNARSRRRHRTSNHGQRSQDEQTDENLNTQQPLYYGPLPSYTYGNQISINPYYNNGYPNYDPNVFPEPSPGAASYYYPSEEVNENEQAPKYFPPTNDDNYSIANKDPNVDPNKPVPINPYTNNTYQDQQNELYKQSMFDF